ncbi:hypothetical protein JB92DRAFT_3108267 [Gautieria morchelliformis]|nr:hypothetical protein JB92DRAFT_3108267 [Gautieria morchelliformis]
MPHLGKNTKAKKWWETAYVGDRTNCQAIRTTFIRWGTRPKAATDDTGPQGTGQTTKAQQMSKKKNEARQAREREKRRLEQEVHSQAENTADNDRHSPQNESLQETQGAELENTREARCETENGHGHEHRGGQGLASETDQGMEKESARACTTTQPARYPHVMSAPPAPRSLSAAPAHCTTCHMCGTRIQNLNPRAHTTDTVRTDTLHTYASRLPTQLHTMTYMTQVTAQTQTCDTAMEIAKDVTQRSTIAQIHTRLHAATHALATLIRTTYTPTHETGTQTNDAMPQTRENETRTCNTDVQTGTSRSLMRDATTQMTYMPPGPQPPAPMRSTTMQMHTDASKTHETATATQHHAPTTLTKTVNLTEDTQLHTQPPPIPPAATTPSTREPATCTNNAMQWARETTPSQPRDSHITKQDPHVHMTGQATQTQTMAAEQRDPCDHANDDPRTHRLPHTTDNPP